MEISTLKPFKEGYCVTSRKFGIVSRIDRPDWKEYMAKQQRPWSLKEGLEWVEALGEQDAEDFYRRCYSKDKLTIGKRKASFYPKSHTTITGFNNF